MQAELPWKSVREFAHSTVVFGISFNGSTAFSGTESRLSKLEGAELFCVFARIIYMERCNKKVTWARFLERFEKLTFGVNGTLNVSAMAQEVKLILKNKRGNPDAPALLLVDEIGRTEPIFQSVKLGLYSLCHEIDNFRLLCSALDVALLKLLGEPPLYSGPRVYQMAESPTKVVISTVLATLAESALVKQLSAKVFEPGLVVFVVHGRTVEPDAAARAVVGLSAGVGRYFSDLVSTILAGRRNQTVMELVSVAALAPASSNHAVGAVDLILAEVEVQAVLLTGVMVKANGPVSYFNKMRIDWNTAIQTGGFSASAVGGEWYGPIVVPPMVVVEALDTYAFTNARDPAQQLMARQTCLASMLCIKEAIKTGGPSDVVMELVHYWWEVASSRARAALSPGSSFTRGPNFQSPGLRTLCPDFQPDRAFDGPLSELVRVDASRPRVNDGRTRPFSSHQDPRRVGI